MKQKSILVICIFLTTFLFCLDLTFLCSENKSSSKYTLENGLEVFLYKKTTLPVINFVFAFNVGSKNESKETSGLCHVLEHCILFRSSKFIDDKGFGPEIRRHGAYYNAHTGRDISLFEISLPSEHYEFALQILKEILFDFDLKQNDLDDEKEVILEEINRTQDDPYKTAVSVVYQNLFQNHSYQKPVYGDRDVIQKLRADQVIKFYQKYFVPNNCALAVVGDFSMEDMENKIQKILGSIPQNDLKRETFNDIEPLKKTVKTEIKMDVEMGYLAIGLNAPGYNSTDQYAADLLTEIFGKGFNPLINQPLRNRMIKAHSLRMSYFCDKHGGAIVIFIGMDPKYLNTAETEITKYLKTSRRLNYSKSDYSSSTQYYAFDILESAKNRIKFNTEEADEQGLMIGYSLVRYLLMNEMKDRGNYLDIINNLNSSDIRQAAGNCLSQKGRVIVKIIPDKKK